MGFSSTWTYTLVTLVTYPIITLILIFILCRHCFLLYQHWSEESQRTSDHHRQPSGSANQSWRKTFAESSIHLTITQYGTPLFVTLALFSTGQGVITRILSLARQPLRCEVVGICVGSAWWLSKGTIYSVFISRLHLAFKNSMYRYSPDFILGLYLLNIIVCTANLISVYWVFCGLEMEAKNGPFKELKICVLTFHYDKLGAFIVAINDVFWTVAFVILFVKPLRSLLNNMGHGSSSSQRSAEKNQQLRMLPVKYTLLTLISTISTFIMVMFSGWFSASLFVVTDYMINSISLVLMTKQWNNEYLLLCGPFENWLAQTSCCKVKISSVSQRQLRTASVTELEVTRDDNP